MARSHSTLSPAEKKAKKAAYDRDYRWRHRVQKRLRDKEYYLANRPAALAYRKKYRAENTEAVSACKKAWYWRNREHVHAHNRAYLQSHPEAARKARRKWKSNHPVETLLYYHARRAKVRGAAINKEDIDNWHSRICGICDEKIIGSFHIDHIIPLHPRTGSPGLHVVENLQLTHPLCNLRKGNGSFNGNVIADKLGSFPEVRSA